MRNNFYKEMNKDCHWSSSVDEVDKLVTVTCSYKGESYQYVTDLKLKVNPMDNKRMTPSAATNNDVVHFQALFSDLDAQEAVALEKELKVKAKEDKVKVDDETTKDDDKTEVAASPKIVGPSNFKLKGK